MGAIDLSALSEEQLAALEAQLTGRLEQFRIKTFFPDEGEFRRELYPKQLAFFKAGAEHRERCLMGGNRSGKSETGAYEMACHLTGDYPTWWEGRRFSGSVDAYAAGSTIETMRDIVQGKLLGPPDKLGTGMLPADSILEVRSRPNTNGAVDYVVVKRIDGGTGRCNFKSYDQGRRNFEGTARQVIWLDEEPPAPIYTECLTRTATTRGIIFITFTPLNGATEIVRQFMHQAGFRA